MCVCVCVKCGWSDGAELVKQIALRWFAHDERKQEGGAGQGVEE